MTPLSGLAPSTGKWADTMCHDRSSRRCNGSQNGGWLAAGRDPDRRSQAYGMQCNAGTRAQARVEAV